MISIIILFLKIWYKFTKVYIHLISPLNLKSMKSNKFKVLKCFFNIEKRINILNYKEFRSPVDM